MRTILALTGAVLVSAAVHAQTLFTYGKKQVTADEFTRAFRKNAEPGKATETAVRNYLDLYIRFSLKVQDAYKMGLDSQVNKQEDIKAFRKQIEDQFMLDSAKLRQLISEARERSASEIRISQIFIPFKEEFIVNPFSELAVSAVDSMAAKQKAEKAYARIIAGEDFEKIAMEYSSDPEVKLNKGDLGFITVFTLPYSLENEAYALKMNAVSKPFASSRGFHIFRKTGERAPLGRMQVQQILIAYDAEGGPTARQSASKLCDSLYQAIKKGASFDDLAKQYSFDQFSGPSGGILPPIAVGMYEPGFESKVFGLAKDGDVTLPFETALGFHIVKRMQLIKADTSNFSGTPWTLAIEQDKRGQIPRTTFEKTTVAVTGIRSRVTDMNELIRYTEAALAGNKIFSPALNEKSVLLELPNGSANMKDWLEFAGPRAYRKTKAEYLGIWEDFKVSVSVAYYRKNLERYNPAFALQMREFTEGNMLFDVMEKKVWSKAGADSAGLRKYYSANKSKYTWGKSADAIVFTASDSATAVGARDQVTEKPTQWKKLMETSGGRIMADSSRMDWNLIQSGTAPMKSAFATPVMVNREDQSATFIYVLNVYPSPSQKTFQEARVQVINDYQGVLEEQWIAALRKQYPVVVNRLVLEKVISSLTR